MCAHLESKSAGFGARADERGEEKQEILSKCVHLDVIVEFGITCAPSEFFLPCKIYICGFWFACVMVKLNLMFLSILAGAGSSGVVRNI